MGAPTEQGHGPLPYPHRRNDCIVCRERDADVQVHEEGRSPKHPLNLCGTCLGSWIGGEAIAGSGPNWDGITVVRVSMAPGRQQDARER